MNENTRTLETGKDRIMADLKRVVHDSQDLLHTSADVMGDRARVLKDRLAESLDAARKICRKLEVKAARGLKAGDQIIRDNPYHTIGVGFALGLLLGVLATRGR